MAAAALLGPGAVGLAVTPSAACPEPVLLAHGYGCRCTASRCGSFELPADYLQQDMEDILTEAVGVEDDSGAGVATGARAAKARAAGAAEESEPDIAY